MPTKEPIILAGPGIDSKDTSKWEYVEVPEQDSMGKPHQGAAINSHRFTRGKTYFMPPDYAKELRSILQRMVKADMRIFQSAPDMASVQQSMGNSGATFVKE